MIIFIYHQTLKLGGHKTPSSLFREGGTDTISASPELDSDGLAEMGIHKLYRGMAKSSLSLTQRDFLKEAWAGGLFGFGGRARRDPPSRPGPIGDMQQI